MKHVKHIEKEELRQLCISKNWFTAGTNSQYEKLFYMAEMFAPLEEIATAIWLCSEEVSRRDIIEELKVIQKRYTMWENM